MANSLELSWHARDGKEGAFTKEVRLRWDEAGHITERSARKESKSTARQVPMHKTQQAQELKMEGLLSEHAAGLQEAQAAVAAQTEWERKLAQQQGPSSAEQAKVQLHHKNGKYKVAVGKLKEALVKHKEPSKLHEVALSAE